jgi:hypothetical protein
MSLRQSVTCRQIRTTLVRGNYPHPCPCLCGSTDSSGNASNVHPSGVTKRRGRERKEAAGKQAGNREAHAGNVNHSGVALRRIYHTSVLPTCHEFKYVCSLIASSSTGGILGYAHACLVEVKLLQQGVGTRLGVHPRREGDTQVQWRIVSRFKPHIPLNDKM